MTLNLCSILALSTLTLGCGGGTPIIGVRTVDLSFDQAQSDSAVGAGVKVTASFVAPELASAGLPPFISTAPTFSLLTDSGVVNASADGTFPVAVGSTATVATNLSTDYLPTTSTSFVVAATNDVGAIVLERSAPSAVSTVLSSVGGPTQVALVSHGGCVVNAVSSVVDGNPVPAVVSLSATNADVYSIAYDQMGIATATKTSSGAASGLFVVYGSTPATSLTVQATGGHTYAPLVCPITPGYVTYVVYAPSS